MEIALVIIGIAAGVLIGWLVANAKNAKSSNKLSTELEMSKQETQHAKEESKRQLDEKESSYKAMMEREKQNLEERIKAEKENAAAQIDTIRKDAAAQVKTANELIDKEKEHSRQLREENEKNWNAKFNAMKEEMEKKSAEQLIDKQKTLQDTNRSQFDELMKPIKEQFLAFQKSVEEAKSKNDENKNHITKTFEDALKLFQDHQDQAVKNLTEQTEKIGNDAVNLTKALKGESKTQGDWGEMILDTMLEKSGLRKGEEYTVQESVKNENGTSLRPDVIVRFPEGRCVVIDSKVSLTAYSNAVAAENEDERDAYLAEHVNSMEKHVNELVEKHYEKLVEGAIGYVLMFVPNESSYIAAMKKKPTLGQEAYKKQIIIISPSNLMMALQLANNLWQAEKQTKNVAEIVRRAGALYDKLVGFQSDFNNIENAIGKLSQTYNDAKKKLCEGKGNLLRQAENMKGLGVATDKQLKLEE